MDSAEAADLYEIREACDLLLTRWTAKQRGAFLRLLGRTLAETEKINGGPIPGSQFQALVMAAMMSIMAKGKGA